MGEMIRINNKRVPKINSGRDFLDSLYTAKIESYPWYRRRFSKLFSGMRSMFRFSQYKRFQGPKECSRRLSQISRGIISKDQLLSAQSDSTKSNLEVK